MEVSDESGQNRDMLRVPIRVPSFWKALAGAAALVLLTQCSSPLVLGNSTKNFVEAAQSVVQARSVSLVQGGLATDVLASGVPITAHVALVNPKNLTVEYSLTWNVEDSAFAVLPPTHPVASSPTDLSFSFILALGAERRDIVFTLGKFVASTDRVYGADTFTVHCDSPPGPAENLVASWDPEPAALVGFTLPQGDKNADVNKVVVTYLDSVSGQSGSQEAVVSYDANPKSIKLSGRNSHHNYSFTVALKDAAGQVSASLPTSLLGVNTLTYHFNGGTGMLPATASYGYGDVATVGSGAGLSPPANSNSVFAKWNTASDGSGKDYYLGDPLTMDQDVDLWAQWLTAGSVTVSFTWGPYGTLALSPASVTVQAGATVVVSPLASGATGSDWAWVLDGVDFSTAATFTWTPAMNAVGQHSLFVTVTMDGVLYSASLAITVTN